MFVGQIGLSPRAGLYCLNGRTGRVLWHFKDNYGFEVGPSVANGVVYASDAADTAGTVFALRASNSQRLWSRPSNTAGGPATWSSPMDCFSSKMGVAVFLSMAFPAAKQHANAL